MSSKSPKGDPSKLFLDRFSESEIDEWKSEQETLFDFYWHEYSYYANERSKIFSKIRKSLHKGSKNFEFENWVRVVDLKYGDNPLSAAGSRFSTNGGRFNIGQIDTTKFPPFPCLYIAEDLDTAMAEKFQCAKLNKLLFGIN